MRDALGKLDFHVNFDLATGIEALRQRVFRRFKPDEANWIESGTNVGGLAHAGQCRGDGSPYFLHPVRVALLILEYEQHCSWDVVVASLLHDALEDTNLKVRAVSEEFGTKVADYVMAVTRFRPADETWEQRRDGKIAKWHQIMNASREVRVIKTFDYCDNTISWRFITADKPAFRKISRWLFEAKTLYLPLAEETNVDAARLIENELQYYTSIGHKIGGWSE